MQSALLHRYDLYHFMSAQGSGELKEIAGAEGYAEQLQELFAKHDWSALINLDLYLSSCCVRSEQLTALIQSLNMADDHPTNSTLQRLQVRYCIWLDTALARQSLIAGSRYSVLTLHAALCLQVLSLSTSSDYARTAHASREYSLTYDVCEALDTGLCNWRYPAALLSLQLDVGWQGLRYSDFMQHLSCAAPALQTLSLGKMADGMAGNALETLLLELPYLKELRSLKLHVAWVRAALLAYALRTACVYTVLRCALQLCARARQSTLNFAANYG